MKFKLGQEIIDKYRKKSDKNVKIILSETYKLNLNEACNTYSMLRDEYSPKTHANILNYRISDDKKFLSEIIPIDTSYVDKCIKSTKTIQQEVLLNDMYLSRLGYNINIFLYKKWLHTF